MLEKLTRLYWKLQWEIGKYGRKYLLDINQDLKNKIKNIVKDVEHIIKTGAHKGIVKKRFPKDNYDILYKMHDKLVKENCDAFAVGRLHSLLYDVSYGME